MYGEGIPQSFDFKLTYVDDEGDIISVSSDHDLREAFLFRVLDRRSTLRVDVVPLTSSICALSMEDSETDASQDTDRGPDWSERVRGKFKGLVDTCQKFGTMLQKKFEVTCSPSPA